MLTSWRNSAHWSELPADHQRHATRELPSAAKRAAAMRRMRAAGFAAYATRQRRLAGRRSTMKRHNFMLLVADEIWKRVPQLSMEIHTGEEMGWTKDRIELRQIKTELARWCFSGMFDWERTAGRTRWGGLPLPSDMVVYLPPPRAARKRLCGWRH